MRHRADIAVAVPSSIGDGTGSPLGGDLLLAERGRRPQLGMRGPRWDEGGPPQLEVGGLDEGGGGGVAGGVEGAQAVEIFLLEAAHLRKRIILML